jgi:hypothetical protein
VVVRYVVELERREMSAVYWANDARPVMRSAWFSRASLGMSSAWSVRHHSLTQLQALRTDSCGRAGGVWQGAVRGEGRRHHRGPLGGLTEHAVGWGGVGADGPPGRRV